MSEINTNLKTESSPWALNLSDKNYVAKQSCVELLEEQRVSDIKLKATYFDNCMNKFNSVYNKFYTNVEIDY